MEPKIVSINKTIHFTLKIWSEKNARLEVKGYLTPAQRDQILKIIGVIK